MGGRSHGGGKGRGAPSCPRRHQDAGGLQWSGAGQSGRAGGWSIEDTTNDWLARAKSDRSNMDLIGREHCRSAVQWWAAAPAARQRGRLGCVAIVTQRRSPEIADAVRQAFIPCSHCRYQSPFVRQPHRLDKLADHAMPCRAALHAQRHPKEHVAIDAGWGPIPLPESPKRRDPRPGATRKSIANGVAR